MNGNGLRIFLWIEITLGVCFYRNCPECETLNERRQTRVKDVGANPYALASLNDDATRPGFLRLDAVHRVSADCAH